MPISLKYPILSDNHILANINENSSKIQNFVNQLEEYKIGGNTIYGGSISSNLNTILKGGKYTCFGTATGAPNTSYSWFVEHSNSNAGTASAYQRAVAYSTSLIIAERTKISSVWGAWVFDYKTTISETPTASNLGTITTHKVIRNGSSVRYKLRALTGTWTADTDYLLCTLSSIYRPNFPCEKTITLRTDSGVSVCAYLNISASGALYITPRSAISVLSIAIDETFLI